MTAKFLTIGVGDLHPIYDLKTGQEISKKSYVILHDHIWLGQDVMSVGNTEIGTGCIVGAQSLVKRHFPNNCMIAGTVAKIIRKDIAWSHTPLKYGLDDICDEYKKFTSDK